MDFPDAVTVPVQEGEGIYVRDPKKRDKVCPKPSQSSEANSSYPCGNASSHAVAELTYLLLRVMSLQMILTANCNSCVSGRRKCRPRSELILAYQCTVHLCGKKYASSQALSLYKKNTHKQPAVPVSTKEARVHPSAGREAYATI